jgi:plastocyanin
MTVNSLQALASGALLASAIFLSACGGSAAAAAPSASGAVKTSTVDLPPSYIFQPTTIEVRAGTTVTWTNHDNFTHSVQVQSTQGVDGTVHMLSPGQSTQLTFTAPGTYAYLCTLHPQNMKGTVVVDPA